MALPYLKWAGGKHRLAPAIATKFSGPCSGIWMEPFCGALSVFLFLEERDLVKSAFLFDLNVHLMDTHVMVQRHLDDLLTELATLPWDSGYRDSYGRLRDEFNDSPPGRSARRSALFIWLNRSCFNGLYRVNRRGAFNVPVGDYRSVIAPTEAHLRDVSRALQKADLGVLDYRTSMQIGADQIYLDPPYVPLSATSSFTSYTAGGFCWDDQVDLARLGKASAERGSEIVASNHDLPITRELYGGLGYEIHEVNASRSISAKGATRIPVREILACLHPPAEVEVTHELG